MIVKNIFLILLMIFVFSCEKNKNNDDLSKSVNESVNDSINKVNLEENKEDSLIEIRKIKNINTILSINENTEFISPTLNISINEMYNFLNSNISSIEDYLLIENWKMYERGRIDKKIINEQKGVITYEKLLNDHIIPGKYVIYRNLSTDSDIYIFENDETKKIKIELTTVNDFNFRKILKEINNNNFKYKDGSILDDNNIDFGNKKYIGEYVPIEKKIKFYKKSNYRIDTYHYIKSPVIEVLKSKETLDGYSYYYNNSKRINEFVLKFYLE